jgi:predicted protein tyrosine phosphatase
LKKKLLFICTYNISRSRTAENLFKNSAEFEVKSAGLTFIEDRSGQLVTDELLAWADEIFMMELMHFEYLKKNHKDAILGRQLFILGIPDEFEPGDPKLIEILESKLSRYRILTVK